MLPKKCKRSWPSSYCYSQSVCPSPNPCLSLLTEHPGDRWRTRRTRIVHSSECGSKLLCVTRRYICSSDHSDTHSHRSLLTSTFLWRTLRGPNTLRAAERIKQTQAYPLMQHLALPLRKGQLVELRFPAVMPLKSTPKRVRCSLVPPGAKGKQPAAVLAGLLSRTAC